MTVLALNFYEIWEDAEHPDSLRYKKIEAKKKIAEWCLGVENKKKLQLANIVE